MNKPLIRTYHTARAVNDKDTVARIIYWKQRNYTLRYTITNRTISGNICIKGDGYGICTIFITQLPYYDTRIGLEENTHIAKRKCKTVFVEQFIHAHTYDKKLGTIIYWNIENHLNHQWPTYVTLHTIYGKENHQCLLHTRKHLEFLWKHHGLKLLLLMEGGREVVKLLHFPKELWEIILVYYTKNELIEYPNLYKLLSHKK